MLNMQMLFRVGGGWWCVAGREDIPSAQTGGESVGFSWQWECMNACIMKNSRVNSSSMESQKVSEKGNLNSFFSIFAN